MTDRQIRIYGGTALFVGVIGWVVAAIPIANSIRLGGGMHPAAIASILGAVAAAGLTVATAAWLLPFIARDFEYQLQRPQAANARLGMNLLNHRVGHGITAVLFFWTIVSGTTAPILWWTEKASGPAVSTTCTVTDMHPNDRQNHWLLSFTCPLPSGGSASASDISLNPKMWTSQSAPSRLVAELEPIRDGWVFSTSTMKLQQ